jgi:hypothetical protein
LIVIGNKSRPKLYRSIGRIIWTSV